MQYHAIPCNIMHYLSLFKGRNFWQNVPGLNFDISQLSIISVFYFLYHCANFNALLTTFLVTHIKQTERLFDRNCVSKLNSRESNQTHWAQWSAFKIKLPHTCDFFISLICLKAHWLGCSFWSQYFGKTDIAGRLTYVVLVSEYLSRWDPNMFCVMPNICSWVQNIFPSWVQVKSKLLVLLWAVGINGQTTQDETEWILQIIKCIFFPFFLLFKTEYYSGDSWKANWHFKIEW